MHIEPQAVPAGGAGHQFVYKEPSDKRFARNYGPANAKNIVEHYINIDPLFRHVRLYRSRIYPYSGTDNSVMMVPVAYVFSYLRARPQRESQKSFIIACAVGEAFSPRLSDAILGDRGQSLAALQMLGPTFRQPEMIAGICTTTSSDLQSLHNKPTDYSLISWSSKLCHMASY